MSQRIDPSNSAVSAGGWLGGYRLITPIGTGGSATVWRAKDDAGTEVALKLLHPVVAQHDDARQRLLREARLVNRIPGDGIARVLDVEADAFSPFVVTELIEGTTLHESASQRVFSYEELFVLAWDLADILDRVHSVDICHRDLKPSNVILSDSGPVLIDFGIAQGRSDNRLTSTGSVTGTPGFVAPEILRAARPSALDWEHGDWFAWAASICFAATGRPPFGTGGTEAVLHRLFQGDADVAGLAAPLSSALKAALRPNPEQRPDRGVLIQVLDDLYKEPDGHVPAATVPLDLGATESLTQVASSQTTSHLPLVDIPGNRNEVLSLDSQPAVTSPLETSWQDFSSQEEDSALEPGKRHRRPARLLSVLLLCAAGWLAPLLGPAWLLVGIGILWLSQITGNLGQRMTNRRLARGGPGKGDAAVATFVAPWAALTSLVALAPGVAAGALMFFAAGGVGEVIVDLSSGNTINLWGPWYWLIGQGMGSAPSPLVLGIAASTGLVTAWLLPSSRWSREGLSAFFGAIAPTSATRLLWTLALTAAVILLVVACVL